MTKPVITIEQVREALNWKGLYQFKEEEIKAVYELANRCVDSVSLINEEADTILYRAWTIDGLRFRYGFWEATTFQNDVAGRPAAHWAMNPLIKYLEELPAEENIPMDDYERKQRNIK